MNDQLLNDTLFSIKKQFLCCVPLKNFDWMNISDELTTEVQQMILKETINYSPLERFPIRSNYQINFIKHMMNSLEEKHAEIHDDLFNALGRLMALHVPNFHFKHFIFHDYDPIIIKENINIISGGTTGLAVWEASLVLSEWCVVNSDSIKRKNVLELGSGLGLTGIAVSRFCNPKQILFSDCHPTVLKILCSNVKLNLKNTSPDELTDFSDSDDVDELSFLSENQTVQVLKLFWENIDANFCKDKQIHYVLAADIVYDSTLFPGLINALKCIIDFWKAKIIFACTLRNQDTLELFCKMIVQNSLSVTELEVPPRKHFIWPNDATVKLITIHRSN